MPRNLMSFAALTGLCSFLLAARCGNSDKSAPTLPSVGAATEATGDSGSGDKNPSGSDIPAIDGDTLYNDQSFEPQPEEGESTDNGSAFSGGEGRQGGVDGALAPTSPN